jgi:hypothetical protein
MSGLVVTASVSSRKVMMHHTYLCVFLICRHLPTSFNRAVVSTVSMSGLPCAADAVKLLDQNPSNSTTSPSALVAFAVSAISPVSPLCVSMMRTTRSSLQSLSKERRRGSRSPGKPVALEEFRDRSPFATRRLANNIDRCIVLQYSYREQYSVSSLRSFFPNTLTHFIFLIVGPARPQVEKIK